MAKSIVFDQDSSAKELIIEHWLIGEGDPISSGQPLVTVRGDNNFYMIRSPYDGFLLIKKVQNGESFKKNDELGEVVTRKEAGEIRITDSLSRNERKIVESLHRDPKYIRRTSHIKATPSARQEARKYNVSLEAVRGSGPDGRIQVKDIHNYIRKAKEQEKAKNTVRQIAYGLPATPLAKRLAKKYDLDLDKVPAPPGAVRIRKKDVERFLRSPESAAAILEEEYIKLPPEEEEAPQTVIPLLANSVISSLPEPKPQIIKLPTDETPVIPSEGVIELDQKIVVNQPKLVGPRGSLFLNAPEDKPEPVIRLTTDVPLSALSDGVIELKQVYKVELDKLLEPETYPALAEPDNSVPIRLATNEISEIPTGNPIPLAEPEKPLELPGHTLKDNEAILADFLAGDILTEKELDLLLEDQTIKNILRLSSSDHSGLASLYFSGPKRVISLTERVKTTLSNEDDLNIDVIARINSVIRDKIYKHNTGLGTLLIKNLTNPIPIKITGTTPSYLEKEIRLKQSLVDQINVNLGEVYIVDLLDTTLTGVSGIVSPEEYTVIYLTKNDDDSIKMKLEFSTENLSEEAGLNLISSLKNVLEDKGSKS